MATKRASSSEIFQLKVTLLGTKPPVWRRLLVPAEASLAQLHFILQIAMGWSNSHLHEFSAGGLRIGMTEREGGYFDDDPAEDENKVRLSSVLQSTGAKLRYTYDFGDSWEHTIVLEKRLPAEIGSQYPICTAGKLACPPEDCGGVGGYYDLIEALADPDHESHEHLLEWTGGRFDPNAFSITDVNNSLAGISRRARRLARSPF
ncbi:MAG: plasmid pRiA4b ORF-3 family protein [Acidobacteria bacterium]|nr:plasmid pRiA4b ORF-3 family protein [Acidobacteriota bacterium]